MMIPKQSFQTARLVVRSFCSEDAPDLFEYLSNPLVYLYEPGDPISRAKADSLASDFARSPDFWAVELTCEHKLIGQIYFSQIEPYHLMTWELGYILSPDYQRKGYTSEAAGTLVRYGFSTGQIHRIIAHCNPDNMASWKLLERIGFRREGLLHKNIYFRKNASGEPNWIDSFVYGMLAEDLRGG
jgi:[ribosomal protein S5]-alanine N-acetyltransferase